MKLVKESVQVIRLNFLNVLGFQLLYRFLTIPLFLMFADRGLGFALKASGYSYVTAGNLFSFLLKPWTLLFLLAAGLMGLFFLTVEWGSLLTAYEGTVYLRKVSPAEMLAGGLEKITNEFEKKSWKLPLVLTGDYLLINLFLICRMFSHVKPVNFVMDELAATSFGSLVTAAGVIGLAALLLPGTFTIHFSMLEQKSFEDSWWNSCQLMKQRFWQVLFLLGMGNLLLTAAMGAVYFLTVTASAVLITCFVQKSLQLAVLLGVTERIELVVLFLFSIFTCILNLGLLTVAYYCMQERKLGRPFWSSSGSVLGAGYRKKLLWLGMVLAFISAFFVFDLSYNGSLAGSDALLEIQITAHRGSSGEAPENTMAAIQMAVEEMADFAEIDVQESLDGVIVLCHDLNLGRLAGVNRNVKDMTLEELQALDVGSSYSAEFAGEPIPTLQEVLEYGKGRISFNIELKQIGDETDLPERVAAMIQEMDMKEQCVVSSVSLNYLERIKAADPDIRTGYIVAAAYGNYYKDEPWDFISLRSSFVTKALVEQVHEAGKAIHVWTVNSTAELEEMKQAGVDNIITDYPVRAREICCREEAAENLLEYIQLILKK
ncbi:MAG: glycerophosphodiester phosphodiesterase [Lachnospiraceae bacterium]|nr:glycerophosphodiester phosphodiesterase [Lachnospiraceae bacterium]